MRVWSYWDGPRSTIHDLCLRTIGSHHPELEVLDRPAAQAAIRAAGSEIDLAELKPNHASDVARWHLLREQGGLWLDADTIVLRRMDWWGEQLEHFEAVTAALFPWRPTYNTGVMAVRKGGWIAEEMCRRIEAKVLAGEAGDAWSSIGPLMLREVVHSAFHRGVPTLNLNATLVYPLPFTPGRRREFHRKRLDREHEQKLQPGAWCYGLTHEVVDGYRQWDPDRLLRSKRFIGFLLRKGLEASS